MPDWTDLNAWMAACWKGSWKVDLLAFSAPLRQLDEPSPEVLLDELQAASDNAIAVRAAPAITALRLRTRCIFEYPFSTTGRAFEEDGLDGVQAVSAAWPQTMRAAGDLSGASGDYQHRRRSFTIGNYCRLPGTGQGYFEKCSLTCHLQFGFTLLEVSLAIRVSQKE